MGRFVSIIIWWWGVSITWCSLGVDLNFTDCFFQVHLEFGKELDVVGSTFLVEGGVTLVNNFTGQIETGPNLFGLLLASSAEGGDNLRLLTDITAKP
jgi:hypothetical protein